MSTDTLSRGGRPSTAGLQRSAGAGGRRCVIDVHAHMEVPEVLRIATAKSVRRPVRAQTPEQEATAAAYNRERDRTREGMNNVDIRLRHMDEGAIDVQLLTASIIGHCMYWADTDTALKADRLVNDRMAEMVAGHPDRFLALGGVTMQAPDLAVPELERCMDELGFKGVQISSTVNDEEIGEQRFWPFWEAAEALGAFVYVHPAGVNSERFQKWQLWNSVGQLLEESMAIASLFYEGVLDRFPRLKICIAHGGGFLPYNPGRVDRNYEEKPLTGVNMSRKPSDYLKMLYYDTCTYDPDVLESLVKKVGASQVLLGSDYPMGDRKPVDFIEQCPGLSAADKEAIVWRNAAALMGVRV
jgi:aminocarboxymuconate-semialdehyde decarboxylase